MPARVFVDTNVLIYARDRRSDERRRKAQAWLKRLNETGLGRLNLQVINEFTRWVLVNEQRRPLDEIRSEVDGLRDWGDKPLENEEVELAWAVRRRLGYQWFDCLLIASAHLAGCRFFLTEDMGKGAVFETVTLVSPFDTAPSDILNSH